MKELIIFDIKGRKAYSQSFDPKPSGKRFEPHYDTIVKGNDEVIIQNRSEMKMFEGSLKDDKPWTGKVYKYDSDGILEKIEIWRKGNYYSADIK